MHRTAWLVGLLAVVAATAVRASQDVLGLGPGAPVLGDMCVTPPHWAPPFTHIYHLRNRATLVFVGVEHTADLTDATHGQIKAAFDRYKPEMILVEGMSATKSAFEWYRKDLADLAKQRTDAGSASENLYAVKLASDSGARFSGWDFSPDQDYHVLIKDKYLLRDALGAHLLRSHINPFAIDAGSNEIARQLRYASVVQPIKVFDYLAWYRAAYGERFDPLNGTPCGTGIASRIVKDLDYHRNQNLIDLIDTNVRPGRTLLVEAGANHWLAVSDWLRSRSISVD